MPHSSDDPPSERVSVDPPAFMPTEPATSAPAEQFPTTGILPAGEPPRRARRRRRRRPPRPPGLDQPRDPAAETLAPDENAASAGATPADATPENGPGTDPAATQATDRPRRRRRRRRPLRDPSAQPAAAIAAASDETPAGEDAPTGATPPADAAENTVPRFGTLQLHPRRRHRGLLPTIDGAARPMTGEAEGQADRTEPAAAPPPIEAPGDHRPRRRRRRNPLRPTDAAAAAGGAQVSIEALPDGTPSDRATPGGRFGRAPGSRGPRRRRPEDRGAENRGPENRGPRSRAPRWPAERRPGASAAAIGPARQAGPEQGPQVPAEPDRGRRDQAFRGRGDRAAGPRGSRDGARGRGRDAPARRPEQKLYTLEAMVDRGFEDVVDEADEAASRRVNWVIVKRSVADQKSGKAMSAIYVLQRDGAETEFPNLGAARAAANKTIVHPEKLTLSKAEHVAAKKT